MEQDVRKILALVRENNEILRKMDGREKRASFFRFIRWIVIIAGLIAAYVYLQPYIQALTQAYQTASETIREVREAGEAVNSTLGR